LIVVVFGHEFLAGIDDELKSVIDGQMRPYYNYPTTNATPLTLQCVQFSLFNNHFLKLMHYTVGLSEV